MYGPLPHTGLPLEAKHRDEKFSLQLPNHLRSKGKPGTAPSVCTSALLSPVLVRLTRPWLAKPAKMMRRVLRVDALRTQSGVHVP